MSVKFKIAFDIDAQTLFGILSKFLPVDNLAVEELTPPPAPRPMPKVTQQVPRVAKLKRPVAHRHGEGPNLKAGIMGIIITHMSDGFGHSPTEFHKALKAAGYSEHSTASRLADLEGRGVIERIQPGIWRLTEKYLAEAQSLPKVATTEAGRASK
jgi:hypothetical protein